MSEAKPYQIRARRIKLDAKTATHAAWRDSCSKGVS